MKLFCSCKNPRIQATQWETECCSNVVMVSHLHTYQSGRVDMKTFAKHSYVIPLDLPSVLHSSGFMCGGQQFQQWIQIFAHYIQRTS